MWAAALCCLSYLGYNYNGCFGCCGPRIFLPNPPDKPSDDGFPRSTVRSRYKRQLIRLNMKKKWPTRTGIEDSRPIFFCKRFSYNENALYFVRWFRAAVGQSPFALSTRRAVSVHARV